MSISPAVVKFSSFLQNAFQALLFEALHMSH